MDKNRLSDYTSLMKQHLISQEILLEYHSKVEAMVEMLLMKDLIVYPRAKMYDYLWVVSDLVGKARELNEALMDDLMYTMTSLAKA